MLKSYLKLLFDLPDEERIQIESASTQESLQVVMTWIVNQGTRVRFRLRTTFQRKEDFDSDDKKDDQKKRRSRRSGEG